jgi:hypothetical protein
MFITERTDIVKTSHLYERTYEVDGILAEISARYFAHSNMVILKFIWNSKGMRISGTCKRS